MKIAVISDMHFGFKQDDPRLGNDSFEQAACALKTAIENGADMILSAGDIFDSRTPKQETWAKALEVMQIPLHSKKTGVELVEIVKKLRKLSPIIFSGIPVIAIHGTHERRAAHSMNPIEVLEKAGYLIHLHCDCAILKKGNMKVAIHGMGGVPEQYTKTVLKNYDPKPIAGCKNIFVFHQSVKGFVYEDEENFYITYDDLPKGFDYYIDGHIHAKNKFKNLLLPGSTVITQMKQNETAKKGFYMLDLEKNTEEFMEIPQQREFVFKKIEFNDATQREIIEKIKKELQDIKPNTLVKIKLCGTCAKGTRIDTNDIIAGTKCIVFIDNEIETDDLKHKIDNLRKLQQSKMSVEEMGLKLVKQILDENNYKGIPPEEILDDLAEGNNEKVIEKIMNKVSQNEKRN